MMRSAGDTYYVAGITVNARKFTVDLSFLPEGKEYVAEIYYDETPAVEDDDWSQNVPLRNALPIEKWTASIQVDENNFKDVTLYKRNVAVTNGSTLTIDAPQKGGFAIRIAAKN